MRYQYNMKCNDCGMKKWIGYHRKRATQKAQLHASYNSHLVTFIIVDMQRLTSKEELISPDLQFMI